MQQTSPTVDFYFDISSPWTYLAFSQISKLCDKYNARLIFKPILVGVIFNKVNRSVYDMRQGKSTVVPAKVRYMNNDLAEWSDFYNLKIRDPYGPNPPKPFPVNSAKVMRGCLFFLSLGDDFHDLFIKYVSNCFSSYWSDGNDISNDDVIKKILEHIGCDKQLIELYFEHNKRPESKTKLGEITDELIELNGFGSPSIVVHSFDRTRKHLYFGNDRLILVERRIQLESGNNNNNNDKQSSKL